MPAKPDNLYAAVDELERVLDQAEAGGGPERVRQLDRALAAVEQAVRLHAEALDASGGDLIDIEGPRIPSPTVTREVGKLRRELDEVLGEVGALRGRLPAGGADFGPIRRRARLLAESLEKYDEEEARVIQETVNTDIGSPD
jgi:hypothetical protein